MPFTAASSQANVQAVRDALIKAEDAIELYMQTNNPGLLSVADAALVAAAAAITTLRT